MYDRAGRFMTRPWEEDGAHPDVTLKGQKGIDLSKKKGVVLAEPESSRKAGESGLAQRGGRSREAMYVSPETASQGAALSTPGRCPAWWPHQTPDVAAPPSPLPGPVGCPGPGIVLAEPGWLRPELPGEGK